MTDSNRDAELAEEGFDFATDANENLRRAFGILAEETQSGESRQFGPVTVASAGVSTPFSIEYLSSTLRPLVSFRRQSHGSPSVTCRSGSP